MKQVTINLPKIGPETTDDKKSIRLGLTLTLYESPELSDFTKETPILNRTTILRFGAVPTTDEPEYFEMGTSMPKDENSKEEMKKIIDIIRKSYIAEFYALAEEFLKKYK